MNNLRRAVLASLVAAAAVSGAVPMLAQPFPQLRLSVSPHAVRLDPGERGTFTAFVYNQSETAATSVTLSVTLPEGGTMTGGVSKGGTPVACSVADNALLCTVASLSSAESMTIEVSFTAPPDGHGGAFVVNAVVASAEQDSDPADNQYSRRITVFRQFVVSNVGDEGGGSLRQTIHDVNALCPIAVPCAILFRIPAPVPERGWFTIQPHTPLPELAGTVKIDGNAQTLFTGDSNPDGPEIEIDGVQVSEESGLRLRPNCDMEVRGLAVNRFPGYGIVVRRFLDPFTDPCSFVPAALYVTITDNYLGTDPRGRTAKPNQRGLGLFTHEATVNGNLISGNRRSGIFLEGGFFASISSNRIGVAADGTPLGNGAGIYMSMGGTIFGTPGADVEDNVIAYNDGMAIARSRVGEIHVTHNSIYDNLQQGIDVDLDGPSPQRTDDTDVPNAPVLFSAAYDPVRNATIVRGRIDSDYFVAPARYLEVYASARLSVWSTPQAEQSVADLISIPNRHQDFEIAVPGDLRGKWITATLNLRRILGFARSPQRGVAGEDHHLGLPTNTSELSNAVMAH
jgi:uncharacterized repeat protein (TIGR01451 family)